MVVEIAFELRSSNDLVPNVQHARATPFFITFFTNTDQELSLTMNLLSSVLVMAVLANSMSASEYVNSSPSLGAYQESGLLLSNSRLLAEALPERINMLGSGSNVDNESSGCTDTINACCGVKSKSWIYSFFCSALETTPLPWLFTSLVRLYGTAILIAAFTLGVRHSLPTCRRNAHDRYHT
jgi:hypothetical protein